MKIAPPSIPSGAAWAAVPMGSKSPGGITRTSGQGIGSEEQERGDNGPDAQNAEPCGLVVRVARGAEGDSRGVVFVIQNTDFMAIDVAVSEAGFVAPDEVRNDVGVRREGWKKAEDVALVGVVNDRVVIREHIHAIEEPIRLTVKVGFVGVVVLIKLGEIQGRTSLSSPRYSIAVARFSVRLAVPKERTYCE